MYAQCHTQGRSTLRYTQHKNTYVLRNAIRLQQSGFRNQASATGFRASSHHVSAAATLLSALPGRCWIGLHRAADSFGWSDSSTIDYVNWYKTEPNDYGRTSSAGKGHPEVQLHRHLAPAKTDSSSRSLIVVVNRLAASPSGWQHLKFFMLPSGRGRG